MSGDGYLKKALKDLTERKNSLADAILSGCPKTFEEYKSMCGEIRGLTFAYEILNDLVRKMESADD